VNGLQYIFRHLSSRFSPHNSDEIKFSAATYSSLKELAEREGKGVNDLVQEIISQAIINRKTVNVCSYALTTLSKREQEVTNLIARGASNKDIASELKISPDTVRTHVKSILRKFEVNTRSDLRVALTKYDFHLR
jgi:DNA-binding NarL/FixJ family response regulator